MVASTYANNSSITLPSFNVQETLKSIVDSIFEYTEKQALKRELQNIEKNVIALTSKVHDSNAKCEAIRDFIEIYHINDIEADQIILNEVNETVLELKDEIEDVLEREDIHQIDKTFQSTLLNAFEELYSTLVNIDFAISQKIAQAYLDGKSDPELLQEA
ncbi:hypothetical protein [Sulfurimonas microaerophilic]|uniref:hypothetical protein n=1 Tax=Sulfurimonas microaerophilic TaxID=3058392 RepID=UPI0027150337|nr:hypothetical protein [Sulfurimonas sp. hsl 1-7]